MPDLLIVASAVLIFLVITVGVFLGAQANKGVKNFRQEHHVGFDASDEGKS